MRSVLAKTLYDRRFFMLGWMIGLGALAALMTSFYPAMRQEDVLSGLSQGIPDAFKSLIGDLADLSQFDTYVASQLFDIRLPLIVGIMAIILGIVLSVGDEEKGELRTVLGLPISRTKLFVEKWLAMVVILAVTLVGLVIGMYGVLVFLDGASIQPHQVLSLVSMTGLLMLTYGTIPFAIGMATGRRAAATGVSIVMIIGSFIVTTFGQAVDWLGDFEKLSLLHYFPAVEIVRRGIDVQDVAVLGVLTTMLLVIALISFRRRDIS